LRNLPDGVLPRLKILSKWTSKIPGGVQKKGRKKFPSAIDEVGGGERGKVKKNVL